MITSEQGRNLLGTRVYDRAGEPVGRVGEVYVSGPDRSPAWLLVVDDSVPARTHLAPCDDAQITGDGVRLSVDGRLVAQAPALTNPPNEPITEADEARLVRHYAPARASTGGSDAMTRSEERVHVTTTTEVSGRVRVRRYIETENVQFTVPVRREKISIEHLPPTGDDAPAAAGNATADDELPEEIILHEERVVILKEVVPTERIRLSREVITETVTVETPLRHERIELETPGRDPQPFD